MKIHLPNLSSTLLIERDCLANFHSLLSFFPSSCSQVFIISDHTVFSLYGKMLTEQLSKNAISPHAMLVPNGEACKTLATAELCWNAMLDKGLDRNSAIIGLGGGAVTDLAGFVASCYMRGIALLFIPTTFLGMVDAAIGGKNGVNVSKGKNMVGTIYQPQLILIDPEILSSLPEREYRSGLAEVIKYGFAFDSAFLAFIEQHMDSLLERDQELLTQVIEKSGGIKSRIVSFDEKDYNQRATLNWGHTYAHAIECLTEYKTYLHGEAVAIGMSCAAHLSSYLGYVNSTFIERQDALCLKAGLPIELPEIKISELVDQMTKDKKTVNGALTFIIAKEIGRVEKILNVDKKVVVEALTRKKQYDAKKFNDL